MTGCWGALEGPTSSPGHLWATSSLGRRWLEFQTHSGADTQTFTAGHSMSFAGRVLLSLRMKTLYFKAVFIFSSCKYIPITEDKSREVFLGDSMGERGRKITEDLGVSRFPARPPWGESSVVWRSNSIQPCSSQAALGLRLLHLPYPRQRPLTHMWRFKL